MIYALAKYVASDLVSRGFPVAVQYGPERVTRGGTFSSVVVISRDFTTLEPVETAHGQQRNARKTRTRKLACVARVHSASSLSGARQNEHERECDDLVDAVIVALEKWGTESRAGDIPVVGRYLSHDEYNQAERNAGVVYELKFQVSRAVFDRTHETAAPEAVSNTVKLARAGGTFETVP